MRRWRCAAALLLAAFAFAFVFAFLLAWPFAGEGEAELLRLAARLAAEEEEEAAAPRRHIPAAAMDTDDPAPGLPLAALLEDEQRRAAERAKRRNPFGATTAPAWALVGETLRDVVVNAHESAENRMLALAELRTQLERAAAAADADAPLAAAGARLLAEDAARLAVALGEAAALAVALERFEQGAEAGALADLLAAYPAQREHLLLSARAEAVQRAAPR